MRVPSGDSLRLKIAEPVVRELREIRSVGVDAVEIGDAAVGAAEHELAPVGRPARTDHGLEGKVEPAFDRRSIDAHDVEDVAPAPLAGERDPPSVGREGALRVEQAQLLEIGVRRARRQPRDALAGVRVGEPEIDEHLTARDTAVREKRDPRAVARQRRGEEDGAVGDARREQRLRELARPVERPDHRQQSILEILAPLIAEVLERFAELALERALDADGRHRAHDLPDGLVAPLLPDVRPEGVTVSVREVLVGLIGHLLDRRDVAVQRRVAHPAVGQRARRTERQVLGHALGEPERRQKLGERLHAVARLAAREDVVLERVDHLVREHVLEAAVVAGEVQQHPVAERLRHAAGALAEIAGDVVLPEIGARREEHDRLLLAELVLQHQRQARVRPLGHSAGIGRRALFGRIVEDLEVLRLQHLPVESIVLHLVLTEVALPAEWKCEPGEGYDRENQPAVHARAPLPPSIGTDSASPQSRSS